jgi:hypothetical protein
MKNIFFSISIFATLTALLTSCDSHRDNYSEIKSTDRLVIDSVQINSDTMTVNSVQSIRTFSHYTSSCQGFYGYDYQKDNLTRNVTAYQYMTNGNQCSAIDKTYYSQFNFQPQTSGTYTFNFWNGIAPADGDSYITKTIVVK